LKEKRTYRNDSGSFTTKYYYHPDRIGSVLFVTDTKGMVIENKGLEEFGNKAEGISKHGLTSNMYDKETGLYYFHARWYDADDGRFLEMDPVLSETTMLYMYDYCNSNPVSNTDRYGEDWINDLYTLDPSDPRWEEAAEKFDEFYERFSKTVKEYESGEKGSFEKNGSNSNSAVSLTENEKVQIGAGALEATASAAGKKSLASNIKKGSVATGYLLTVNEIYNIIKNEKYNDESKMALSIRAGTTGAGSIVVTAIVGGVLTSLCSGVAIPLLVTAGVMSGLAAGAGIEAYFETSGISPDNKDYLK